MTSYPLTTPSGSAHDWLAKGFKYLLVVAWAALITSKQQCADPKRCFPLVRKIQTDHRDKPSNMTLNSFFVPETEFWCMSLWLSCDQRTEWWREKACVTYRDSVRNKEWSYQCVPELVTVKQIKYEWLASVNNECC